jgi:predicted SnoaL-like aldol condensation-catalyzing enzyme
LQANGEERFVAIEENKATWRRIVDDMINGKRLELAEELFAAEHELHPDVSGIERGPEGMRQAFAGLHEEFPDVEVTIDSMVAEGDMVAVRLTFSGTQTATGERSWWPELVFTRFVNGKAAESWEVTDTGRSWVDAPW